MVGTFVDYNEWNHDKVELASNYTVNSYGQ